MAKASNAPVGDLSYEAALAELEKIVSQLETGQVPLEQSIEIYERGAALKSHCEARLKAAELKVQQIVQSQDGKVALQPAELTR